jgi:hypothetical protein
MLRFTYQRIFDTQHKLQWNAYFEAFCVHARNLALFLRNDDDSRTRQADQYVKFKAPAPPIQIKQPIAVYVVHAGTSRSAEAKDKFNRDDATKAFEWIEEQFKKFLAELPPDFRDCWSVSSADPTSYEPTPTVDAAVQTACTHPIAVSSITNQSHTSHIVVSTTVKFGC